MKKNAPTKSHMENASVSNILMAKTAKGQMLTREHMRAGPLRTLVRRLDIIKQTCRIAFVQRMCKK